MKCILQENIFNPKTLKGTKKRTKEQKPKGSKKIYLYSSKENFKSFQ